MTTSVRLPKDVEALLAELARQRGETKSQVIRDALAQLAQQAGPKARPLEAISHLLGVADSGGLDLSERTGKRFREHLQAKQRRRDAR